MASASFRDRMNDLGWSRREQPANTSRPKSILGTLSKLNPFSGEGYVRLPTTEGEGPGAPLPARTRREEEEGWFARKFARLLPLPPTSVRLSLSRPHASSSTRITRAPRGGLLQGEPLSPIRRSRCCLPDILSAVRGSSLCIALRPVIRAEFLRLAAACCMRLASTYHEPAPSSSRWRAHLTNTSNAADSCIQ